MIKIRRNTAPMLTYLISVIWLIMGIVGCSTVQRTIPQKEEGVVATESDSSSKSSAVNHYLAGSIAEEAEEFFEAAVEFQLALLYDPTSTEISTALSRVYLKLGHLQPALFVLENAHRLNPRDDKILEMLAFFYYRTDQVDKAYTAYSKLTRIRQLEQKEYLRLAQLAQQLKHYDEAVAALKEYLHRFGEDAGIYEQIARIYIEEENFTEAEKAFREVVRIDSTRSKVLYILGGMAVGREEWKEAEVSFRRAAQADSSEVRYWFNWLLILSEQRRYEDVVNYSEVAIDLFPTDPRLYDLKAAALEQLKRLDEALKVINQSIIIDSTRASPYLTKGYIYHQRREWDLSAQTYEKGLEINPAHPTLLNNYAYMLSEQNARLEEALEMVQRALAIEPNNASFLDTRGWIYYRLQRYKEALRDVNKALKGLQDTGEGYAHLAQIYQALGEEKKAKQAWRRAAELEADNEEYKRSAR